MATDPTSGQPRPFDVKTVEHLIGLMAEHDLTEIALQEGEKRIRLRKGGPPAPPAAYPTFAPLTAAPAAVPAAPAAGAPAPPVPLKKLLEIKSEMVGTYYSRPKPDKDDYVKVGARIKPDTIVCLIEAMKIFNEMPAGLSGAVAEICVANGDPVEFGTVLFRIDPA